MFLPRGIRSYAKSPFGKMKQHNHYKAPLKEKTEEEMENDKDGDEADANEADKKTKDDTTEDEMQEDGNVADSEKS